MGNALRHVRGESQKNIVRFIEGLSGKYSRWDIWQDFIIMSAIAKKLNRTTNAVKVKAQRLGLGAVLMAGEYVTLNQLLLAVNGGSSSYGYKMKSWVENRGLPVHTKRSTAAAFGWSTLKSSGSGPSDTAASSTFPKWSRWRSARSRAG